MMPSQVLWRWIAAATSLVVLVSCSGSSRVPSGDDAEHLDVSVDDFVALLDLLPPETTAQRATQRYRQRQERIADCMTSRGLAYEVREGSDLGAFEGGLLSGSDEWVQYYGFGISTLMFPQSYVGEGLVGYLDDLPELTVGEFRDAPNGAGAAEVEDALYGDDQEPGCVDLAFAAVLRLHEDADPVESQLGEIRAHMDADPRVQELYDSTRACMRVRGLHFVDIATAQEEIFKRTSDLLAGEPVVRSDAGAEVLPSDLLAELAQVQEYELEYTSALHECGAGAEALRALHASTAPDYLDDFIDLVAGR